MSACAGQRGGNTPAPRGEVFAPTVALPDGRLLLTDCTAREDAELSTCVRDVPERNATERGLSKELVFFVFLVEAYGGPTSLCAYLSRSESRRRACLDLFRLSSIPWFPGSRPGCQFDWLLGNFSSSNDVPAHCGGRGIPPKKGAQSSVLSLTVTDSSSGNEQLVQRVTIQTDGLVVNEKCGASVGCRESRSRMTASVRQRVQALLASDNLSRGYLDSENPGGIGCYAIGNRRFVYKVNGVTIRTDDDAGCSTRVLYVSGVRSLIANELVTILNQYVE